MTEPKNVVTPPMFSHLTLASVFTALIIAFISILAAANDARAAEDIFIVGFPEDNMANDWRAAQVRELADELRKQPNIRFIQADAGGQVARNLRDIEDMVHAGAKLIFLGPRDAKLMTPVVRNLRSQGIYVVLLTRRIESEDFDSFISPNDFTIGQSAANYLADYLGGKGRILMLEGVRSATTAIKRSAGFRDGLSKHPGVKLVTTISGNYSRAGGIRAMENAIRDGIKFDAIYSHNDAMLVGARLALRAAGIDPATVPSVGIDYIRESRDAIRNGEQLGSFKYPTVGKEGARIAIELLKGNRVPKYIDVPSQLVTKANVETVDTVF